MNRNSIEKIAQTPEDKLLLSKLWDKINTGVSRNIPAVTGFLSRRELAMAEFLFGSLPGLNAFGGYDAAERRVLWYLPAYLSASDMDDEDAPIACIRAEFYENDTLSHRDFLGALMGLGIARETVGDILVRPGGCDFFVGAQIVPFLLEEFTQAGRTKLRCSRIALSDAVIPEPSVSAVHTTVASLRLDSILRAGFSIDRAQAADAVLEGRAAIDGLPCKKPDKPVAQGAEISVRGLGKIKLEAVNGSTKKGRISVDIVRYL